MRGLRGERKLTQEEAAEIAKLDGKHWQDIEGARTNPTMATLVGVARALKVTIAELFEQGGEESDRPGDSKPARPAVPPRRKRRR